MPRPKTLRSSAPGAITPARQASPAQRQALALAHARGLPLSRGTLLPADIVMLQRSIGNRLVSRLLSDRPSVNTTKISRMLRKRRRPQSWQSEAETTSNATSSPGYSSSEESSEQLGSDGEFELDEYMDNEDKAEIGEYSDNEDKAEIGEYSDDEDLPMLTEPPTSGLGLQQHQLANGVIRLAVVAWNAAHYGERKGIHGKPFIANQLSSLQKAVGELLKDSDTLKKTEQSIQATFASIVASEQVKKAVADLDSDDEEELDEEENPRRKRKPEHMVRDMKRVGEKSLHDILRAFSELKIESLETNKLHFALTVKSFRQIIKEYDKITQDLRFDRDDAAWEPLEQAVRAEVEDLKQLMERLKSVSRGVDPYCMT